MVTFLYKKLKLTLPSPELNDTESLDLRNQIDRAMDGTIYSYVIPAPIIQFHCEFRHMNVPQIMAAMQFFQATAGQPVTYIDYTNTTYTVAVLNDPWESVHQAIRNNVFSLDLEVVS